MMLTVYNGTMNYKIVTYKQRKQCTVQGFYETAIPIKKPPAKPAAKNWLFLA